MALPEGTPAPIAAVVPAAAPTGSAASAEAAPGPGQAAPAETSAADPAKTILSPDTTAVPFEDFALPDGFEADATAMGEFKTIAGELKLDQAGAQKLVDLQAKFMQEQGQKAAEAFAKQAVETWDKMRTDWLKEAKADPDIGGQKFDSKVEAAKRALKEFGSPGLISVFEQFGLGNHPEVIRFVARVGETLGEDKIVTGGAAVGAAKSLAERLFPSATK